MKLTRFGLAFCIAVVLCFIGIPASWAFCGFYVAKADVKLFNQASQVILAHSGERTVLTMANDFQGDVKEFAIVVPVPVVLQEEQVHVGDRKTLERLDAFSAPRLVEYFDPDPCQVYPAAEGLAMQKSASAPMRMDAAAKDNLGVTIEAKFSVGEYDILILSAKESSGLETWLKQNGYRIPANAQPLLQPYIRRNLKFFVAKVNLEKFNKSGFPKPGDLYKLPMNLPGLCCRSRLGMANASAAQDLVVYALSPRGQVELTNYRTVRIPSDVNIPLFVKEDFARFYTSLFQTSYEKEGKAVAFLEYAWDMANCDPCSANPLTPEELKQAGVFWQEESPRTFITRLHVRYARPQFPEDLQFQETSNQQSFQGRYILRHPFTGNPTCAAGEEYRRSLPARFNQEAQTLAQLTGWKMNEIKPRIPAIPAGKTPWWKKLWP